MKIKQVSDLHLEFGPMSLPNNENANVLVLGGDIFVAETLTRSPQRPLYDRAEAYRKFISAVCNDYENVIMVCGNHEHYNGCFDATHSIIRDEFKYNNFYLLDDESVTIGDTMFYGATLWTDLNRGCQITESQYESINDYKIIRRGAKHGYRKLLPRDTKINHSASMHILEKTIENAEKVYVATHYAPSYASIDLKYKTDYYGNGFYASDISEFILDRQQIKVWSHGHIHCNNDYMIGECRVVSNPRGYVGYELNPDFMEDFIVEM